MVQRFTDQQENRVNVRVGEEFSIVADVNTLAGYQLSLPKFDQTALKPLTSGSDVERLRRMDGATTVIFHFKALTPGEHVIEIERRQPEAPMTFISKYKIFVN